MRLLPFHRGSRPRRRGQAMVEFALVLPLLALLLVMAIDFGRVFFGWVALQNAARIAADAAAGSADAWPADNPFDVQAQDHYQAAVIADLEAINCEFAPPVPDPEFPDGKETGDPAIVTLECGFDLITPLAGSILGGSVDLRSEATFPIHRQLTQSLPSPPVIVTPTPVPTPSPGGETCTVPGYVDAAGECCARPVERVRLHGVLHQGQRQLELRGRRPEPQPTRRAGSLFVLDDRLRRRKHTGPDANTPAHAGAHAGRTDPRADANSGPDADPGAVRGSDCQLHLRATEPNPADRRAVHRHFDRAANCPITSRNWNFGDGSATSPAQNPTHRYNYGSGEPPAFTVS